MIGLEESGEGAQWSNIATSPRDGDSFSLLECILMLMLDAVIYLLLTLYIEAVFPGSLNFALMRSISITYAGFV